MESPSFALRVLVVSMPFAFGCAWIAGLGDYDEAGNDPFSRSRLDASSDGGTDAAPTHAPAGITFRDQDPRARYAKGNVGIGRAADERDVAGYRLYWGTATTKSTQIVYLSANGQDPSYALDQPIPPGATHLLAFSENAGGEMEKGVAVGPVDAFPIHVDISAGQGAGSGTTPSAIVDTASGKLLVATKNDANGGRPSVYRCNLDGSACTPHDVSGGEDAGAGVLPSIAVDAANAKLLVATQHGANGQRPALFVCELDGTACIYRDISAGQGVGSGYRPSLVVDAAGGKLLVATRCGTLAYAPGVFLCNVDGTNCTFADISVGQGIDSATSLHAVIDVANAKLLVVTQHGGAERASRPSLFRCELNATGCTHTDLSAGQGPNSGQQPFALVDAANGKLVVVTKNGANGDRPALFRCDLNGSNCGYADLSAGQGAGSGEAPSAVIDTAANKLLVVTSNGAEGGRPGLFRCELDGSACTYTSLAAEQGIGSGRWPTILLDPAASRLLVTAENAANAGKLGLYLLPTW